MHNNRKNYNYDISILRVLFLYLFKEYLNVINFFQYLVTNDKILMVKSKVNEICSKDSEWLRSIATDKNQSESNIFQGKFLVTI